MQKVTLHDPFLMKLGERVEAILVETNARFSGLNAEQINWRPSDAVWSIGQCFDHLITTNKQYFTSLQPVLASWRDKNQSAKKPFRSGLFGRFFVNAMKPNPKVKVKSPAIFRPSQSAIPGTIFQAFADNQQQVLALLRQADGADLNGIKVASPVNKMIRFRLGDCFDILVTHEERHLEQARHVLAMAPFAEGK